MLLCNDNCNRHRATGPMHPSASPTMGCGQAAASSPRCVKTHSLRRAPRQNWPYADPQAKSLACVLPRRQETPRARHPCTPSTRPRTRRHVRTRFPRPAAIASSSSRSNGGLRSETQKPRIASAMRSGGDVDGSERYIANCVSSMRCLPKETCTHLWLWVGAE